MPWTDAFVAAVSILLGVVALAAGVFNWDASFQLPQARRLEARFGRRGARVFYAALGVLLILLGLAIAAGFGPNATPRPSRPAPVSTR